MATGPDVVDVLVADHAAPRVVETLRGRPMMAVEGGTQALRRTVDARLRDLAGGTVTVSVPSPFGALVLKAAAYRSDTRDRERHLRDAVLLLAVVDDPYCERQRFTGSDRSRLVSLGRALLDSAPAWRTLPDAVRADARTALRILTG